MIMEKMHFPTGESLNKKGAKRVARLTDEEIMLSVKADRVEKLAILFERHHVKVYNYLLRLTGDRIASQDLVQEIFYRILKYRESFRGDSKFLVWMYQIARNIHLDYLRKQRNHLPLEDRWDADATPTPGPAAIAEQNDDISLLHQALDRLPVQKKELIILSRFQNLKYREIAQMLGCSLDSIKVNIYRAIRELREHYANLKGGLT